MDKRLSVCLDIQKDMMKLIVAFRNFASLPKNGISGSEAKVHRFFLRFSLIAICWGFSIPYKISIPINSMGDAELVSR